LEKTFFLLLALDSFCLLQRADQLNLKSASTSNRNKESEKTEKIHFFCNNIFQKPNLFFKGKTFVMKFELFSNRSISQSYLLASLFSLFETCFVIFKSKCPHQLSD
jgi:hypothetical protein